jgi:hypothetical protein
MSDGRRGQRGQHPGVVGTWVVADDEDRVAALEVVELDGPLADPDRLGQRQAARLVTHVRAIGEVVRAVLSGEELEEERRLVARLAGRVEDGFVRASQGAELGREQGEGVVPGDRLVAIATGA